MHRRKGNTGAPITLQVAYNSTNIYNIMTSSRRYTFLFLGLSILTFAACILSCQYLYNSAQKELWNNKMESGQRETREVGRLLEDQLKNGIPPAQVIKSLQQSILNTDTQSEFICMYNTDGVELCHPDPAAVGRKLTETNSTVTTAQNNAIPFNTIIQKGKSDGGIRQFPANTGRTSEIINVYRVSNTNWMVASHVNIAVLEQQLMNLYWQCCIVFLLSAILIVAGAYALVRFIYRKYERQMETAVNDLNEKVNTLSILNQQLTTARDKQESSAKRIITYQKDEIVSLDVIDLAFFYLADGNTHIVTCSGNTYTTTTGLDELMKQLDNNTFYRANRQFIIHIKAVKMILIYGKNQLKLIMEPAAKEDIIISKNKVAAFKNWLQG